MRSTWIPAFVLAAAIQGVRGAGRITCYGFDGNPRGNNTRCPGSNACCGIEADCLSNRLCHNPGDGPGILVRGPCRVDPYDSGTCAQICLYSESTFKDETTGFFPRVHICDNGSLCCENRPRCCNDGAGIFLDNQGSIADRAPSTTFTYGPERTAATFQTASESTTTSSQATTSVVSSTSLSSRTPIPSGPSPYNPNDSNNSRGDDDDRNLGLIVGLSVSIPLVCIIAICFAVYSFWWRKRTPSQPATQQHPVDCPVKQERPIDFPVELAG
ncbi:hypothetical protein P152DRAFT_440771 [Eremomyces bilateralis CBS 781.70]|uniref:Mid2 domain-containing protein n=1 Tax=Eremomyces bilateralis CBS 781.70 TaxID=1392243 RepID=A0A6G1FW42_9PEZI|nr:uncharacterized protein P152DRAFT_440771 [Eremomyces bilateralis CBS 781.70]KAF1810125.1 hypothetical protein P152DRAFT_440771 [Eremomyces bilateralis CBS 781.70]